MASFISTNTRVSLCVCVCVATSSTTRPSRLVSGRPVYKWSVSHVLVVCQMHLADYLITLVSVCPCVCPQIGCRTITSAILYRFSPNFACRSGMWLFRTLLFLRQTGSRLPILEMCKVQFWQFRNCGGHIFPRFVTKVRIELKLISIDFIVGVNESGVNLGFREVQISTFGIDFVGCRTITSAVLYRFFFQISYDARK